jgi:hypothetical protein
MDTDANIEPTSVLIIKILNHKQAIFCTYLLILSFSEEVYLFCHEKSLEDKFDHIKTGDCLNVTGFLFIVTSDPDPDLQ